MTRSRRLVALFSCALFTACGPAEVASDADSAAPIDALADDHASPSPDVHDAAVVDVTSVSDARDAASADAADAADAMDSGDARAEDGAAEAAAADAADAADVADASVRAATLAVLAPRANEAETRRLLRFSFDAPAGVQRAQFALNGAAAVPVAVTAGATSATISLALPLRPGPNTLTLTVVDALGRETVETRAFRFGAVVGAGGSHSGAIVSDQLWMFGRNNTSQLGISSTDASRNTPAAVMSFGAAGSTVAALSLNQNISFALRSDGTVWGWGENSNAELGLGDMGSTTRRGTPTQIVVRDAMGTDTPITDAISIAAGYNHALVLRADGSLWAFGQNDAGQVGVDGSGASTDRQLRPVRVAGITGDIVKIAAGSAHSLALTADGRLWVWGRNSYGNHGAGTTDTMRHPSPTVVPMLADIVDVASGRDHVLAVRADGRVFSWGLGASGQLGYGENTNPETDDRASPVAVVTDMAAMAPLEGAVTVVANGNSSFVRLANGQLWGFGADGNGTLAQGGSGGPGVMAHEAYWAIRAGVETLGAGGAPTVYFDESHEIASMSAGAIHAVVLTRANELYTWGWNTQGTLGISSFPAVWRQPTPVLVTLTP